MLMSELSARSGVPVPTVKYYLRAGLLHPGVATSVTRSTYDDSHVRRLRLVRALVEVGGLRLREVRAVITAVGDESVSMHRAMGTAHGLLSAGATPPQAARDRVDQMLSKLRWRVVDDSPNRDELARALDALEGADHPVRDETLQSYAASMHDVAETDLGTIPSDDREAAVRGAVLGTVLVEPVLAALRRLAQEDVSARRFGARRGRRSRG